MGQLNIEIDNQARSDIENIANNMVMNAVGLMDDIADIGVEYLQVDTPIGETHELHDLAMWLAIDQLTRYIFSASGHFEPVVAGHLILGPLNTEKQIKWWFWYLNNVLGGSYDPKYGTGNTTPPNDYPSTVLVNADSDIDTRLDQFLTDVFGG